VNNGISIPPGFRRHTASRFVIIVEQINGWKLIAKTWFSVQDLLYYIEHNLDDRSYRIFDFKEMYELKVRDSRSTQQIAKLKLDPN